MAVVRFEPLRELAALQNEMSRFLNQGFGGQGAGDGGRTWLPPLDVWETENEIVISVDLPGVSGDQASIEVEDGVLTISGTREREAEVQDEGYFRFERRVGSFSRSVTLPQGVSDTDITADFKDGVLAVRIPKPEERKPKRIPIGAQGKQTVEGEGKRK